MHQFMIKRLIGRFQIWRFKRQNPKKAIDVEMPNSAPVVGRFELKPSGLDINWLSEPTQRFPYKESSLNEWKFQWEKERMRLIKVDQPEKTS